jgi:hypothetical protein
MTYNSKMLVGLLATAFAITWASGASAAKREKSVSFERAWALCKAELDREKIPGPGISNDRYIRGGGCMARYGYRL